jgi:HPt (histidine-containing phosphotransfer) domain-containing protein
MTEIFRRHEVLERLEGDEDLLRELVDLFLSQSWSQIGEMKAALAAGDAASIRHQAHSLKGAAAGLGAGALSFQAARLEKAGKEGNLEAVGPLLQAVQEELSRFQQAVTS